MNDGNLQAFLFLLNRPEPIRQSSLLMVLATGLGDNVTLLNGLRSLAAESGSPWSDRVNQLRLLLEQGQTLSEALITSQGLLPEQTLIAIRVGEETGTLKQVLAEEAHRLMNRPVAASPVQASLPTTIGWLLAVGVIMKAVVAFIMFHIIPKFKKIFNDFGVDLPDMTNSLIGCSDWLLRYWYLVIFPALTLVVLLVWKMIQGQLEFLSTGRIWLTEYIPRYWSPLILRLLGITITAGATLTSGIHAILKELQPGRAAKKLSAVRLQTDAGEDCWQALQQNGFLTRREVAFLESAARTSHLDWGLLHLSRTLERRRSRWSQRIAATIQPLTVLLMGLLVGFVCIALFLPLVKLLNDLS
ncbi:MAG: type II secretion system F family protein [Fuerstiella sp.]